MTDPAPKTPKLAPDKENYPAISRMLRNALEWRLEHPERFPQDQEETRELLAAVLAEETA